MYRKSPLTGSVQGILSSSVLYIDLDDLQVPDIFSRIYTQSRKCRSPKSSIGKRNRSDDRCTRSVDQRKSSVDKRNSPDDRCKRSVDLLDQRKTQLANVIAQMIDVNALCIHVKAQLANVIAQ